MACDIAAAPGALIIMDVDGAEDILLGDDTIYQFRRVGLQVRTHN